MAQERLSTTGRWLWLAAFIFFLWMWSQPTPPRDPEKDLFLLQLSEYYHQRSIANGYR